MIIMRAGHNSFHDRSVCWQESYGWWIHKWRLQHWKGVQLQVRFASTCHTQHTGTGMYVLYFMQDAKCSRPGGDPKLMSSCIYIQQVCHQGCKSWLPAPVWWHRRHIRFQTRISAIHQGHQSWWRTVCVIWKHLPQQICQMFGEACLGGVGMVFVTGSLIGAPWSCWFQVMVGGWVTE